MSSTLPQNRKSGIGGGPKPIFLGFTALVFVAGFSYYFVKTQNTAKRREFFTQTGQSTGGASAQTSPQISQGQSPLQSLAGVFTRQAAQRDRTKASATTVEKE